MHTPFQNLGKQLPTQKLHQQKLVEKFFEFTETLRNVKPRNASAKAKGQVGKATPGS